MTDQYKEQYKKETEQIHAPADLIARTKAVVREEEARIQRERAAQATGQEGKPAVGQTAAVQKKHGWSAAARKWAYPMTAVAAIFILVSVSMMMRGLGKTSSDTSMLLESAAEADCGGEESAAGGVAEEGIEEAFESAEIAEQPEMEAASVAQTEDMAPEMETASEKSPEDATAGMAEADSAAEAPTGSVDGYEEETKRGTFSDQMDSGAGKIENTLQERQEAELSPAEDVSTVNVAVKRVWKRPAFADSAEAERQTYEDKVFWVVKEDEGWAAYVESESKGGYEIRGEAEDLEAFLEAGYRRLEEISY